MKAIKSRINWLLKIAFVGALLYVLGQRGFLSAEATAQAFMRWDIMAAALLLSTTSYLLGAFRWHILLKTQDIHLSPFRVLELTLVGNFFSLALPGAVTGDFVKAYYVGKEKAGIRARGFGSILFDRLLGVSALVIVSLVAMIFHHEMFESSNQARAVQFFVYGAGTSVAVFYLYLFFVDEQRDVVHHLLKHLAKKKATFGSVLRTYEGVKTYGEQKKTVLISLSVSVLIHLLICICAWLYLVAVGGSEGIAVGAVFAVSPLGLLVTGIPVLPAGVGTGHAAFLWLYGLLGTSRGADVFTLLAAMNIFFGVIGGIVYLRFKATEPALPAEVLEA